MSNMERIAESLHTGQVWSAAQVAHIFTRLIVQGLLENDLTPERAERYATRSAHYAGIYLRERDADPLSHIRPILTVLDDLTGRAVTR